MYLYRVQVGGLAWVPACATWWDGIEYREYQQTPKSLREWHRYTASLSLSLFLSFSLSPSLRLSVFLSLCLCPYLYLSLSLSTMPDDTEVVEGNKKTVEKNISFCCCDKCQGKEVSLATFYNHGYITGDQDNPRVTWVILRKHQRKKPRNVRYSLTIMYNYNWYDLNRIRRIKVEKHLLPRDSLPHPKFWNLAVRILMMRRIMIQMMIASV